MKNKKSKIEKALNRLHKKGLLRMTDITTVIENYENEFEYLVAQFGEDIAVEIYNESAVKNFVAQYVK